MRLARLAVHTRTREPLALLLEVVDDGGGPVAGDRCLVMSLRAPQAEVVAQGPQPDRSDDRRLTQDLLGDLAAALGRRLVHVAVIDLVDDRFHAQLVLDDGTAVVARPSDALAVAVRDGLPVLVAQDVLDRAGQSFAALDPPPDGGRPAEHQEIRELRQALDGATAEDFRPDDERRGSE